VVEVTMKPLVTFSCTNAECRQHDRTIEVQNYTLVGRRAPGDVDGWLLGSSRRCPKCRAEGKLDIQHGDRKFTTVEAFGEYLGGLLREAMVLKKLVARKVATRKERLELEEKVDLLRNAQCTCCGRSMTKMLTTRPTPAGD